MKKSKKVQMTAIDTYKLRTITVEIFDDTERSEIEVHVTFESSGRLHRLLVTARELSPWERTIINQTIQSQVFVSLIEYYANLAVNPIDVLIYEDALLFLGEMKFNPPIFIPEEFVDEMIERYKRGPVPMMNEITEFERSYN